MAKSRLKTSLVALVIIVLLAANVVIEPASAAGLPLPLPSVPSQATTSSPTQTQPTQTTQSPSTQSQQTSPSSQQQQQTTATQPPTNTQNSQAPQPSPTNTQGGKDTAPAQSASQGNESPKQNPTSGSDDVVFTTVTSYSSFSHISSATSAASANSNSGSSESSGSIIVPLIVVGCVVIAAALGIWIFRKWKLSPSRDFKEKIQPIDFSPTGVREDSVFLRGLNEP